MAAGTLAGVEVGVCANWVGVDEEMLAGTVAG